MKCKLVFERWIRPTDPVDWQPTDEEIELSMGDLHSGTIFGGSVAFTEEDRKTLRAAAKKGYRPCFYLISEEGQEKRPCFYCGASVTVSGEEHVTCTGAVCRECYKKIRINIKKQGAV